MKPHTRTRLLWTLMCATIAYALVNVCVYLATGAFPRAWLLASVIVHVVFLAAALVLMLRDRATRAQEAAEPAPAAVAPPAEAAQEAA